MESLSITQIFSRLSGGGHYVELWEEYEAGLSPEARFVHEVDRLEMALQASIYEQQGYKNMGEFFRSAEAGVTTPALRTLLGGLSAPQE